MPLYRANLSYKENVEISVVSQVTSHNIQNHKENVMCAHSEGQDPTGSDQPSRLCLNLTMPQPQQVQLSTQPTLLVQPG